MSDSGLDDLRLLRRAGRRDAGAHRQPARPVRDCLPRRRARAVQGVACSRGCPAPSCPRSPGFGTRDGRRFHHRAVRCAGGHAGRARLLPGAHRQRELPAHRDRAALHPGARPPDRLPSSRPGVAASTYLAFTLQEAPGSPALAAGPVDNPGRHQGAERARAGRAAADLRDRRSRRGARRVERHSGADHVSLGIPNFGDPQLWLAGRRQAGCSRATRSSSSARSGWTTPAASAGTSACSREVEEDRAAQRTRLAWAGPLGHGSPHTEPAGAGATVYVFRQRAALFGHNAPGSAADEPGQ